MAKYEQILLATDFSEQAEKALVEAVRVAAQHGAELHILHVDVSAQQNKEGFENHPHWDHTGSMAQESMDALGRDVTQYYRNTVLGIMRDSSASAGILRYVTEKGIDLIVVGTHGRRPLSGLFLGSVAQEVVRHSLISVLVVGYQVAAEHPGSGKFCILAPVDFSAGSTSALIHAGKLAAESGAHLIAMHVVDSARLPHEALRSPEREEQRARDELERYVAEAHLPIPAETVVSIGHADDAVLDLAEKRKVGLIVIAPHHHSMLDRLLHGSVSTQLLRGARCPVLVHHDRTAQTERVEAPQSEAA